MCGDSDGCSLGRLLIGKVFSTAYRRTIPCLQSLCSGSGRTKFILTQTMASLEEACIES